jgi:hypothetical protein
VPLRLLVEAPKWKGHVAQGRLAFEAGLEHFDRLGQIGAGPDDGLGQSQSQPHRAWRGALAVGFELGDRPGEEGPCIGLLCVVGVGRLVLVGGRRLLLARGDARLSCLGGFAPGIDLQGLFIGGLRLGGLAEVAGTEVAELAQQRDPEHGVGVGDARLEEHRQRVPGLVGPIHPSQGGAHCFVRRIRTEGALVGAARRVEVAERLLVEDAELRQHGGACRCVCGGSRALGEHVGHRLGSAGALQDGEQHVEGLDLVRVECDPLLQHGDRSVGVAFGGESPGALHGGRLGSFRGRRRTGRRRRVAFLETGASVELFGLLRISELMLPDVTHLAEEPRALDRISDLLHLQLCDLEHGPPAPASRVEAAQPLEGPAAARCQGRGLAVAGDRGLFVSDPLLEDPPSADVQPRALPRVVGEPRVVDARPVQGDQIVPFPAVEVVLLEELEGGSRLRIGPCRRGRIGGHGSPGAAVGATAARLRLIGVAGGPLDPLPGAAGRAPRPGARRRWEGPSTRCPAPLGGPLDPLPGAAGKAPRPGARRCSKAPGALWIPRRTRIE